MIEKLFKGLLIAMIIVGLVVCVFNFTTAKTKAWGMITYYGTYSAENWYCPGPKYDCYVCIILE